MEHLSNPKYMASIVIVVLLVLFIPCTRSWLAIFDYNLTHILIIATIIRLINVDLNMAMLITILYMVGTYQRHNNVMSEMLDASTVDPNISSYIRQKLALRIINNDAISDESKCDFTIKALSTKTKAIYRLNIILEYMNGCNDPKLKEKVLRHYISLKSKNMLIVIKMILDNDKNMEPVLNVVSDLDINPRDKLKILKRIGTDAKDKEISEKAKMLTTRKVSFNV